jgi:hypothetical protein
MPITSSADGGAALLHRYELEFMPASRRFDIHVAEEHEIPALVELTASYLPAIEEAVPALRRVQRHSRSLLAVKAQGKLVGAFGLLTLNERGFRQLLDGKICVTNPDINCLTQSFEYADAIYAWALCLPGHAAGAVGNLMKWLRRSSYMDADIYACAGSDDGDRFIRKTGFRQLPQTLNGNPIWVYRRRAREVMAVQKEYLI